MRTSLAVLALVAAFASPLAARADAIPGCPPGQHVVFNPVPPGAQHHGGAHCEPNAPPATHHHPPPPPPPPPAPPSAPPSGSGGSRS